MSEQKEKSLVGIGGWLTLYLSGLVVSTFLIGGQALSSSSISVTSLVVLIATIVAWFSLLAKGKWVRTYQIGFNALLGIIGVAAGLYLALVGAGVWIAYWVRSKRVAATYAS